MGSELADRVLMVVFASNIAVQSRAARPVASTQQLNCFIAAQVESTPYTAPRSRCPRRSRAAAARATSSSTAASSPSPIRHPSRQVSRFPRRSTPRALLTRWLATPSLGTLHAVARHCQRRHEYWTYNATTTFPATITADNFVQALNNYLINHAEIAWDATATVPITVATSGPADVLLPTWWSACLPRKSPSDRPTFSQPRRRWPA